MLPVLVMGSCPGVGKTTLVEALVASLRSDGVNVDWFPEEAVLEHDAFAKVAKTFRSSGRVVPQQLLTSSAAYVESWSSSAADVVLVDSLFPFVSSLLAIGADESEIDSFVGRLWDIVRPARPLTLYVDGAPRAALDRAHETRGDGWWTDWTASVRRWMTSAPLLDIDDIATHFERERALTLKLLADVHWNYSRLDADRLNADAVGEIGNKMVQTALRFR